MLNKIWCFVLIISMVVAVFTGNAQQASNALLNGGKEAVELFITMAGAVGMWCGIMNIAEKSGAVSEISKKIMGLLRFLFPSVPPKSNAMHYIAVNMTANFLGLGWAATPSGIMAVNELSKLGKRDGRASDAICMFMVINMSSIQLISINIISYRMKYGSTEPFGIVLDGIIATAVSTVTAVFACKMCERSKK